MTWLFGEQVLRMLAGVLLGVWVAKYLGPERFGTFSYVLATVAIFSNLSKLGLDSIIVRGLVQEPGKRDVILGTAFWLRTGASGLALLALALACGISSVDATTYLYLMIVGAGMVFQGFEVVDYYFQSQVLSKFVTICRLAQLLISSILKLYFVISRADLFWFVLVTVIEQATLALTLFFAYRSRGLGGFYARFDRTVALQLLRDAWPLAVSALMIVIYMRIDQIMIRNALGDHELGIFSAAVKLTEIWYVVAVTVTTAFFPAVVAAKAADPKLYALRLQQLYGAMVWLGIAIALPISVFSQWIVDLLYGAEFSDAGPVLSILIWTLVLVNLLVSVGQFLVAENRTSFALFRNALGVVANVGFNLLLIPRFGIIGAALSSLMGYFCSACLSNLFWRRMWETLSMELKAFMFPIQLLRSIPAKAVRA